MSAAKPVRLEFNNSGSWKMLGVFDADQPPVSGQVMTSAVDLVKALNFDKPRKQWPSFRLTHDDNIREVIAYWTAERGCWFSAKTKEAL